MEKSAIKANLHTSIGSRVDLWSHKTVAIAFGIKAFVWMKFANGEIGQLHNKPHTNIHAYERVGAANDRRQEDLLHCSFEYILFFKHFIFVLPFFIRLIFFRLPLSAHFVADKRHLDLDACYLGACAELERSNSRQRQQQQDLHSKKTSQTTTKTRHKPTIHIFLYFHFG